MAVAASTLDRQTALKIARNKENAYIKKTAIRAFKTRQRHELRSLLWSSDIRGAYELEKSQATRSNDFSAILSLLRRQEERVKILEKYVGEVFEE